MNTKPSFFSAALRCVLVMVCTIALLPGDALTYSSYVRFAQTPPPQEQVAKIPPDQMDSLVAPIALYPDTLLAQALVASTYPLELIQLQQWLAKNPGLKDQALADAVSKQPWDPSIQALAGLPEVVKRLTENISWTTDLGNAFLAQQGDVMDAAQRMRKWLGNRSNRGHRQRRYSLASFGLDGEALRAQFKPYTDTFDIQLEWPPKAHAYGSRN